MNVKSIIKLFIPPICGVVKRCLFSKETPIIDNPLKQIEHHSEKIIILGNGPSLTESVIKFKTEILNCDRVAVNFFASSDFYELIKPNIYVFADPAFFDIPDAQKDSIETLIHTIVLKTKWPMRIVVPQSAKGKQAIKMMENSPNISIGYYYNGWNDIGKRSKFEAWDENLIGPPAQNVLSVALYLSLFWGYKETYLIGADSSFLEDLRVDQETNELYTIDKHFYANDKVHTDKRFYDSKKRGRSRSDWTLHGLIYAHGRMFEDYYELKQYADFKGLKVYNASEYSWINVFERKKLK